MGVCIASSTCTGNGECDTNGECVCSGSFVGSSCAECSAGFWLDNGNCTACARSIDFCASATCDAIDGGSPICVSCDAGYTLDEASSTCIVIVLSIDAADAEPFEWWIIVVIVVGALMLIVGAGTIFWCCKRNAAAGAMTDDSEKEPAYQDVAVALAPVTPAA